GLFEGSQRAEYECADVIQSGRVARIRRHDNGDRGLAPYVVVPRDHRDIGDVWVAGDGVLHFYRRDVFPTGNDEILGAIDDINNPILVFAHEVAGMEPAVASDVGRFVWLIPVSGHQPRSAVYDFTDLAVGYFDAVGVNDLGGDTADGFAHRAHFGFGIGIVQLACHR